MIRYRCKFKHTNKRTHNSTLFLLLCAHTLRGKPNITKPHESQLKTVCLMCSQAALKRMESYFCRAITLSGERTAVAAANR